MERYQQIIPLQPEQFIWWDDYLKWLLFFLVWFLLIKKFGHYIYPIELQKIISPRTYLLDSDGTPVPEPAPVDTPWYKDWSLPNPEYK